MFRSGLLAKLVLGAFVLNAPLCPCAALAADLESAQQSAAKATEPAAGAGHAQHHGMADQGAADRGTSDSTADCHGAVVDDGDCDMATAEDANPDVAKSDRYGNSFAALVESAPALRAAASIATHTRAERLDATRLPIHTPITSYDRLLT